MSATLEELVVKLTAETSSLQSELANATKVTEKASQDMQKALEEFSQKGTQQLSAFDQAVATMAGVIGGDLVLGALNKLKEALAFVITQLHDGVDAAAKDEQQLTRLANALALTGHYSTEAMKSLQDYVEAQERITGTNSSVIASNLATLESITHLRTEGLMKAETAAMDFAAAFGIDVETANRLVAKGIEGNVGAFKRYGLEVKAGADKAQNLDNVLKALSTTQGAASGQMGTFTGSLTKLSIVYEDFLKQVGKAIIQNPVFKAIIDELTKSIDEMGNTAKTNGPLLQKAIGQALVSIVETLGVATEGMDLFFRTVTGGIDSLNLFSNVATDVLKGIRDDFDFDFSDTEKSFDSLTETFSRDTTLSTLAQKLADVSNRAQIAFDTMGEGADVVAPKVKGATKEVTDLTEAQKNHIKVITDFAQGLADQGAAIDANYKNQMDALTVQLDSELITRQNYADLTVQAMLDQQAKEDAALEDAHNQKLIGEAAYQNAKTALAQKQNADALALSKKLSDQEKAEQDKRKENLSSTFNTIATLADSNNKTLSTIGKAAAITQATIDGYVAVGKALASAPPPFNFALAALVGTAAAANVAKIAGVGLATGIDEVPGVGSRDNYPAVLAPGERVVPKKTNQDLKKFLNNQDGNGKTINLTLNINNNLPASREAGAAMIEQINEALANGSLKILGMT
jgi:hypothetical protein